MTHVWNAAGKRDRLIKRQKNKCYWCGRQMNRRHPDPLCATLDHFRARANGGGGNIENLVAACKECNEKRGREREQAKLPAGPTARPAAAGLGNGATSPPQISTEASASHRGEPAHS